MATVLLGAAVSLPSHAVDGWTPRASLSLSTVMSDNVLLAPRGQEKTDIMLRTAPSFGVSRNSGRLRLNANFAPIIVGYVNDSAGETLFNSLVANSTLEVLDNSFFVDTKASVQQAFISPFGAQPGDTVTSTRNRTEVSSFSVAPYFQGRVPYGWGRYTLRHDLTFLTTKPATIQDVMTNRSTATWSGEPGNLFTPSLDYSYTQTQFGSNQAFTNQFGRARLTGNFDPEFSAYVSAGYENNDLISRSISGSTYGAGFTWTPRPRTTFSVGAEDRYYGKSYTFSASHQTRMSVWKLNASRSDQLLQERSFVSSSASAREQLNELLRFVIPDPAARAQEVERLLQSGTSLLTGQNSVVFNTRVNLVTSVAPSVAITGVRNTLTFSAFRREVTPLSSSVATNSSDPFLTASALRQSGMSVTNSWLASEMTSVFGGVDLLRSRSIGGAAFGAGEQRTNQQTYRIGVNRKVGPASSVSGSLRFMHIDVTGDNDVIERAVLLTFTHNFYR